jgi:hypothetical protein
MSGEEGFVGRWSRRKQEAANEAKQDTAAAKAKTAAEDPMPDAEAPEKTEPEFDISKLPPIESINASTDIRAFLSAGVPAHLTRAALRAAWTSDPAIRDYIGLSENSWDFNTPGSMAGFGPLDPSLDVQKMVADVFGQVKDAAGEAERLLGDISEPARTQTRLSETPVIPSTNDQADEHASGQPPATGEKIVSKATQIEAAPQREENPEPEIPVLPRRHGSALPS